MRRHRLASALGVLLTAWAGGMRTVTADWDASQALRAAKTRIEANMTADAGAGPSAVPTSDLVASIVARDRQTALQRVAVAAGWWETPINPDPTDDIALMRVREARAQQTRERVRDEMAKWYDAKPTAQHGDPWHDVKTIAQHYVGFLARKLVNPFKTFQSLVDLELSVLEDATSPETVGRLHRLPATLRPAYLMGRMQAMIARRAPWMPSFARQRLAEMAWRHLRPVVREPSRWLIYRLQSFQWRETISMRWWVSSPAIAATSVVSYSANRIGLIPIPLAFVTEPSLLPAYRTQLSAWQQTFQLQRRLYSVGFRVWNMAKLVLDTTDYVGQSMQMINPPTYLSSNHTLWARGLGVHHGHGSLSTHQFRLDFGEQLDMRQPGAIQRLHWERAVLSDGTHIDRTVRESTRAGLVDQWMMTRFPQGTFYDPQASVVVTTTHRYGQYHVQRGGELLLDAKTLTEYERASGLAMSEEPPPSRVTVPSSRPSPSVAVPCTQPAHAQDDGCQPQHDPDAPLHDPMEATVLPLGCPPYCPALVPVSDHRQCPPYCEKSAPAADAASCPGCLPPSGFARYDFQPFRAWKPELYETMYEYVPDGVDVLISE